MPGDRQPRTGRTAPRLAPTAEVTASRITSPRPAGILARLRLLPDPLCLASGLLRRVHGLRGFPPRPSPACAPPWTYSRTAGGRTRKRPPPASAGPHGFPEARGLGLCRVEDSRRKPVERDPSRGFPRARAKRRPHQRDPELSTDSVDNLVDGLSAMPREARRTSLRFTLTALQPPQRKLHPISCL